MKDETSRWEAARKTAEGRPKGANACREASGVNDEG